MLIYELAELDNLYNLCGDEKLFHILLWPIFIIPNLLILIKTIFNKRKSIWNFIKHNIQSVYKRAFKKESDAND